MKNDLPDKAGSERARDDASPQHSPAGEEIRTIRSEELFAGARVVLIQHAGEIYRLLITRNDRLILQK